LPGGSRGLGDVYKRQATDGGLQSKTAVPFGVHPLIPTTRLYAQTYLLAFLQDVVGQLGSIQLITSKRTP
jgi:hypothetical protein